MPNRVRFDGSAKRFYEVWYFIFVEPTTGDGYWIRYTLLNPTDDRPESGATLWFARTCRSDSSQNVAVRRTFPSGSFEAISGAESLRIGGAELAEGSLRGSFAADGHEVSWDLRYEPSREAHYFFGPQLRRIAERRTSVTIPNPKIALTGTVSVDERSFAITDALGHEAHHWGAHRAPRWNWGHCCAFEDDPEAVLELLSAEGPGGVPVTFLNLHSSTGVFRCDKAAGLVHNRAVSGLGFWRFEGHTGRNQILVDVTVDPRYVQRFVYTSPTYRSSECWNTTIGDALVRIYRGSRPHSQRLERVIRARGTVAAEIHDERPERIPYSTLAKSDTDLRTEK